MTRRRFLALGLLALPTAVGADTRYIEPTNVCVKELVLNEGGGLRFAHFTDFHYKGDADYAAEVIATINAQRPEFVCFSGDLVEQRIFAPAALDFIRQIEAPVYGVPGNHDYSCGANFADYERAFAATGGEWLLNCGVFIPRHNVEITSRTLPGQNSVDVAQDTRRVLLIHYPILADHMGDAAFDLILAGHSHGGQVRLPFIGAPVLPGGVGRYDMGYFETKAGPLYVNPGIGTLQPAIRFNCRPEITVVTM